MFGLLILTSCCKDEEVIGSFPPVFFQYEDIYESGINLHNGWFIDTNGHVKVDNLPAN